MIKERELKEVESPVLINGAGKFTVVMQGGLEPDVSGPYDSEEQRDEQVKIIHSQISEDDNLFALDIDVRVQNGQLTLIPTAWCWSGGFFEGEDDDA